MFTPADLSPPLDESHASTLLRTWTAVEGLTDDLVIEILVRVPFKSLCRFRCVSKHWLGLIDHPDNRKRLPQTLAGFFHTSTRTPKSPLRFVNVSSICCPPIDVSFSFLPNNRHVKFLDGCNGLLLCHWYHVPGDDYVECCYVVCNPATREWAVLPDPSHAPCRFGLARLGFDPAVSSNFYVFLLLPEIKDDGFSMIAGVEVYSSETRRWVYKKEGWNKNIMYIGLPSTVFLNGCLHFHAYANMFSSLCLAAVDTTGETWTIFHIPGDLRNGFLQQSQGCLHFSSFQRGKNCDGLVVYVLKDYDKKEWILKHSVENSNRSGGTHLTGYSWIVIHPQCDMMFLTETWATKLMQYNMDHGKIKVISSLERGDPPYVPYVPFYVKLQSLEK